MAISVDKYYSLDEILYNLLHDYEYRNLFLKDKFSELNISEENLKQIQTIDKEELIATSKTIIRNLLNGNIEHSGGLKTAFPGTFKELELNNIDLQQLMYEFVASKEFEDYKEIPYAGDGQCIEESFFCFLSNIEIIKSNKNIELLLKHEFLNAMISILVVNAEPAFKILSKDIKHNGHIYYASIRLDRNIAEALLGKKIQVQQDKIIWLFAAAKNRLIKGPIEENVLQLIEIGSLKKINEMKLTSNEETSLAMSIYKLGLIKS
ncbi:hypothetical protein OCF64_23605 [Bacillus wiedmannii]|uniref:hypothetical protein n=1 Tax=Bacillus wiedmannii TaxID=1890302 RepID=UPI000BF11CC2|nr:hypothetical protein [Bacillus wiedmannii]MCU5684752.1 hypothetical protein [Bacillus wiedmannii]PEL85871.1 hypothetical protein CN626_27120 [Bacillus wiedmannii]